MIREEVEVCPNCMGENIIQWDVERNGYEIKCKYCGEKMMLCDACFHSNDNLEQRCNYHEINGCFRKKLSNDTEEQTIAHVLVLPKCTNTRCSLNCEGKCISISNILYSNEISGLPEPDGCYSKYADNSFMPTVYT